MPAPSLDTFKVLTFDVVGTLIDFEKGILDHLRAVSGRSQAELSDATIFASYLKGRELNYERSSEVFADVYRHVAQGPRLPEHGRRCRCVPALRAALAGLLGFGGGAQAPAQALPPRRDDQCRPLGLLVLFPHPRSPFHDGVTYDDTGVAKPNPQFFAFKPRPAIGSRLQAERHTPRRPEQYQRHRHRPGSRLHRLLDRASPGPRRVRRHARARAADDARLPLPDAGKARRRRRRGPSPRPPGRRPDDERLPEASGRLALGRRRGAGRTLRAARPRRPGRRRDRRRRLYRALGGARSRRARRARGGAGGQHDRLGRERAQTAASSRHVEVPPLVPGHRQPARDRGRQAHARHRVRLGRDPGAADRRARHRGGQLPRVGQLKCAHTPATLAATIADSEWMRREMGRRLRLGPVPRGGGGRDRLAGFRRRRALAEGRGAAPAQLCPRPRPGSRGEGHRDPRGEPGPAPPPRGRRHPGRDAGRLGAGAPGDRGDERLYRPHRGGRALAHPPDFPFAARSWPPSRCPTTCAPRSCRAGGSTSRRGG